MTSAVKSLLQQLEDQGVRLYVSDGHIRVRAPKNVLTADLQQQIRESRTEIMELLRDRPDHLVQIPPLVPVGRDAPLPLSFAQQRLWFLDQLEPGSVEYVVPSPVFFDGDVDVAALGAALSGVVGRHEVLRTRLVAGADGVPYQVIDPPSKVSLPVVDASGLGDPRRLAQGLVEVGAAEPFDLAAVAPVRACLIRLSEQEHVLALTMHHVVTDGWSERIFRRELDALYTAFRRGEPNPLPMLH